MSPMAAYNNTLPASVSIDSKGMTMTYPSTKLHLYRIDVPVEKIDLPTTEHFDWINRDLSSCTDENGNKHAFIKWEEYSSNHWDVLSAYLRRIFAGYEYKEEVRFHGNDVVGSVLLPPLTQREIDDLSGYLDDHGVAYQVYRVTTGGKPVGKMAYTFFTSDEYESFKSKCGDVAKYWGDKMPMMAMEELAELSKAVSKMGRTNRNSGNAEAERELIKEMSDVIISIGALQSHYGISTDKLVDSISDKLKKEYDEREEVAE